MLAILTTHPIQYQVPLWQALAQDGRVPFEVWYLTSHALKPSHDREFGSNFAWDLEMLSGYPHRFLDVVPGAAPGSFWKCRLEEKLRHRLRDCGASALWIQGWQVAAYWQAVWEANAAEVEVWLRGESNDLAPVAWWKSAAKRVLLGQLFNRVDRFLYIGSANRRLYKKFGVSDEKLFPAPYAVDNGRFAAQAAKLRGQRSEIRGQWKIPEDSFVVLFCGKFIPKKRPMDLIAAARLLRSKQSGKGQEQRATTSSPLPLGSLHLLFAGSGELGADLRSKCNVVFDAELSAKGEGERGSFREGQEHDNLSSSRLPLSAAKPPASFTGFLNQTEVSRAYIAADVLVLPSDYLETWGLVVNEAMASGLPCIVSDRCGCAEDLGNIPPNMTYECGNAEQLAKRLTEFENIRNDELAADIQHYSFNETVRTIARIWQH